MVDASTITDDAAESWNQWLRSARMGPESSRMGPVVGGPCSSDKVFIKNPPRHRGKWSSSGRRKGQLPDVLGMVGYLKGALHCMDDFEKAPFWIQGPYLRAESIDVRTSSFLDPGRRSLLLGKYITASLGVRVQRPGGCQAAQGEDN